VRQGQPTWSSRRKIQFDRTRTATYHAIDQETPFAPPRGTRDQPQPPPAGRCRPGRVSAPGASTRPPLRQRICARAATQLSCSMTSRSQPEGLLHGMDVSVEVLLRPPSGRGGRAEEVPVVARDEAVRAPRPLTHPTARPRLSGTSAPGDNWGTQPRRNAGKPEQSTRRRRGAEVAYLQGQSACDRRICVCLPCRRSRVRVPSAASKRLQIADFRLSRTGDRLRGADAWHPPGRARVACGWSADPGGRAATDVPGSGR
jgi:hypothetical protein